MLLFSVSNAPFILASFMVRQWNQINPRYPFIKLTSDQWHRAKIVMMAILSLKPFGHGTHKTQTKQLRFIEWSFSTDLMDHITELM